MLDVDTMYNNSIVGTRDYFHKCGMEYSVVGNSGGVDSALTLAISSMALGADHTNSIIMDNAGISDAGDHHDALELASNFGFKTYNWPITDIFRAEVEGFRQIFGVEPSRLTQENWQPRIRGTRLMAFTNHFPRTLLISTGNKSELGTGYGTLYGDMNGGVNAIGDYYKGNVYQVCLHHNEVCPEHQIPLAIINKEPSARLWPGQRDRDSLPEYPIVDAILKLYIEFDYLSAEEREECARDLALTSSSIIDRVLAMVDKNEFKRKQGTTIIRTQKRAFGDGWRMPVAARYTDTMFHKVVLDRLP
jgi:NAD+ synthetase